MSISPIPLLPGVNSSKRLLVAEFQLFVHKNLFYLPQVIEVVAGKHTHDVFDGLLSVFRMNTAQRPLFRREGVKQRKILHRPDAR